jgi:uncharacterized membrane protein
MSKPRHDRISIISRLAGLSLTWIAFAALTDGRFPIRRISLTRAMNEHRRLWMRTAARRDLRMIDTAILAGLQNGTAFFASTTILAIGGCFALLGSTERVLSVAGDLPIPWWLTARPSRPRCLV